VHGAQRVLKARVAGTRIHQMRKPKLLHATQPLKVRVLYNLVRQRAADADEPVNGVVDYFLLFHKNTKVEKLTLYDAAFAVRDGYFS
jgi:hypothetical protein